MTLIPITSQNDNIIQFTRFGESSCSADCQLLSDICQLSRNCPDYSTITIFNRLNTFCHKKLTQRERTGPIKIISDKIKSACFGLNGASDDKSNKRSSSPLYILNFLKADCASIVTTESSVDHECRNNKNVRNAPGTFYLYDALFALLQLHVRPEVFGVFRPFRLPFRISFMSRLWCRPACTENTVDVGNGCRGTSTLPTTPAVAALAALTIHRILAGHMSAMSTYLATENSVARRIRLISCICPVSGEFSQVVWIVEFCGGSYRLLMVQLQGSNCRHYLTFYGRGMCSVRCLDCATANHPMC